MRRYGFWRTLELDPTRERADIKRAYARKLKVTSPEDDAAGFQALREAYERALAYAEHDWEAYEDADAQDDAGTILPEAAADLSEPLGADPAGTEPSGRDPIHAPPPSSAEPLWPDLGGRRSRDILDPSEQQQHQAALTALARLVEGGSPDPAEVAAALDKVLRSPLMESLAAYAGTEQALSQIAANNFPASDPMTGPLIAYFQWDDRNVRRHGYWTGAVLARDDDLKALAKLQATFHTHHKAYKALAGPPPKPTPRWLPKFWFGPSDELQIRVAEILASMRRERPGLIASLNPESVAWWDAYANRAPTPSAAILGLALGPILPVAVITASLPAHGLLAAVTLYPLAVAILVWGIIHPRKVWRERLAATAPPWLAWGWLGLVPLVILASTLLPATPVGAAIVGVGAAGLMLWSVITEGTRMPPPESAQRSYDALASVANVFSGRSRSSWFWQGLGAQLLLWIWWLIAGARLGPERFAMMTMAQVAVGTAALFSGGRLAQAWTVLPVERQRWALTAVGALALSAGGWLWAASSNPLLWPVAAAFVTLAVVAHRVPASVVKGAILNFRPYTMAAAALAMMVTPASSLGFASGGALVLLAGVATIVVISLAQDHLPVWKVGRKRNR